MKQSDFAFDFIETDGQFAEMEACIASLKTQAGSAMPALQEAQRIYGYLPIEVLQRISDGLGYPLEELYSTATFYSQFSFVPKGEYTISVCMGTACYVKGAGDLLDELAQKLQIKPGETSADRKFTLESCRCIGACGLAPVLTVNEEVHGRLAKGDAQKVLVNYIGK